MRLKRKKWFVLPDLKKHYTYPWKRKKAWRLERWEGLKHLKKIYRNVPKDREINLFDK